MDTFLESIFYVAWRGIAIGLIISAPMGPVGMLCIQRTLDKGRRAGLYTGIGAAISDLFYSLLTGFGLSFIEDFLERNQNIIQLVGSFVLIGFGVYLFRKNPSKGLKKPLDETVSVEKSILGGFLFTFSNPLILFLIVGLFARFNFILPAESGGMHVLQYIVGFIFIFIGAIIWWWFITFSIDKVRSHFNIRSMWLINKIIGTIIFIFAVVGIITATTALARGSDINCWNGHRGYGPFSSQEGSNRIENVSSDTLFLLAPCNAAAGTDFRCKVRSHKTSRPWGFVIEGHTSASPGQQERLYFDVRATESEFDGISTQPTLEIEMRQGRDWEPSKKSFVDNTDLLHKIKSGMQGPDPTGSMNFFKIVSYRDMASLFGGLHSPVSLMSSPLPEDFLTDSIGIYLTPGSCVSIDEIRLACERPEENISQWDDPWALEEYLSNSRDWHEGYWQLLDRNLDESLLRLGGDYRYALVRSEDGYDLLYLSGAKVNPDEWSYGMLKAKLRPSGIKDVWDVVWFDAMHHPLSHELKAQTDQDGTLTIQFPYQGSQIRLHHSQKSGF